MSQAPGLSVGNAMRSQPRGGNVATSLLGGFLKFRVEIELLSNMLGPVPRM